MRLKELRGNLKQKEVLQHIKKTDPRVDSGLYSKYENGIALPTPNQLKAICELLGVEVLDIYNETEINLNGIKATVHAVKEKETPDTYNLCVRLDRSAAKWFCKDVLEACGYRNLTHWVNIGLLRLKKEYKRAEAKAKKKPPALSDQTDGTIIEDIPKSTTNAIRL